MHSSPLENRLLLYDVASGRLVRELPAAGGIVRGAGWFSRREEPPRHHLL
jgi:hypothetical protein